MAEPEEDGDDAIIGALRREALGSATESDGGPLTDLLLMSPARSWRIYVELLDSPLPWAVRDVTQWTVIEDQADRLLPDNIQLVMESVWRSPGLRALLVDFIELTVQRRSSYFVARALSDLACAHLGVDRDLRLRERADFASSSTGENEEAFAFMDAVASLALHHRDFAALHVTTAARNGEDPGRVVRAVAWASSMQSASLGIEPRMSINDLSQWIEQVTLGDADRRTWLLQEMEWTGASVAQLLVDRPNDARVLTPLVHAIVDDEEGPMFAEILRRVLLTSS